MTAEIRTITFDELLTEGSELFVAHREELTTDKELMVLKLDIERYKAIEAVGALLILGVFINEKLVGYSVNFIGPHLHYADLRYAANDVIFLTEKHRRGRIGLRLIDATEKLAKEHGAQMMVFHAKEGTTLTHILPKKKYRVQDIVFSRSL
jgi:GNAT superfamily N-acetyltransferase